MSTTAPFERYKDQGRVPLGSPKTGDGTSRHGYGRDVFKQCGWSCVYCERDLLESYESWLDVSIDHVIPQSTAWDGSAKAWVKDIFNLVTCCRACNEFLNQHTVRNPEPATVDEFTTLRDQVFAEKRKKARKRHDEERVRFEQLREGERGRPS